MHVCVYVSLHVCMQYVWVYECMCMHLRVCVYVCVRVCVCEEGRQEFLSEE